MYYRFICVIKYFSAYIPYTDVSAQVVVSGDAVDTTTGRGSVYYVKYLCDPKVDEGGLPLVDLEASLVRKVYVGLPTPAPTPAPMPSQATSRLVCGKGQNDILQSCSLLISNEMCLHVMRACVRCMVTDEPCTAVLL